MFECTVGARDAAAVLQALVEEHGRLWYPLSTQFVGLTLYCLTRHELLLATPIERQAVDTQGAVGPTPFAALVAAVVKGKREGDLRVAAARLLLEERFASVVVQETNLVEALQYCWLHHPSAVDRCMKTNRSCCLLCWLALASCKLIWRLLVMADRLCWPGPNRRNQQRLLC